MKGVVFLGDRKLELRDFPDPTPGPDEVVLAIKASGMCGSDLISYRAPANANEREGPFIRGHEPCGIVAARGTNVTTPIASEGARAMVFHYYGCGACENCLSGWAQMCQGHGIAYSYNAHGAHAPYMKVPARTLVPLPDTLSFAEGAAVSCATGTAFTALKRMHLGGGETVAVFGQGPVGLSVTVLASAMDARVIVVDIEPQRLSLAKEFGADAIINAAEDDPVESLMALTGGYGANMAIDCSGSAKARAQAVRATRSWGAVCFLGEGGTVTLDVSDDMLRKQLTLIGSWTFSHSGQGECAAFVAEHGITLERIFTHRFDLDEAEAAYRLFDTQTTGKGVFVF